jgi:hypothetical protein
MTHLEAHTIANRLSKKPYIESAKIVRMRGFEHRESHNKSGKLSSIEALADENWDVEVIAADHNS